MTVNLLIGLISFGFVMSITPGPNNLMLLASGANFGFRRTLPHIVGISLGLALMVLLVGLGLAGLFLAYPPARTALKLGSIGYMLWLAWRIAHAAAPGEGRARPHPMTLLQAAAFQWVNPKAWIMALGAITNYTQGQGLWPVIAVAAIFSCINLPTVSIWAKAGEAMRYLLTNPNRLQVFNWTMATLLVLSLWPVLEF
jgi:threonine/homoserine/homoserine lactone efflux protein